MRKFFPAVLAAFVALMPVSALAQASRTYVSSSGDDDNLCSRTSPCRHLGPAFEKTATGGEIVCLDALTSFQFTITRSITIDCSGVHAVVTAVNVTGVVVDATSTSTIVLRGLTINGVSSTVGNGIRVVQAQTVIVDDVTIEHMQGVAPSNGSGIRIEDSDSVRVAITNSRFYSNNQPAILSIPTAGTVALVIDNVEILRGATNGIQLRQNTSATLNGVTVALHNAGGALMLEQASATANVGNSVFANNAVGLINGTGGGTPTTRLSATMITGNTMAGLQIGAGSQVISIGNNTIRGNAGNENPTQTLTPN